MLIYYLKWKPINTLARDGSNDSDLTKMNPLTKNIWHLFKQSNEQFSRYMHNKRQMTMLLHKIRYNRISE